MMYLKFLLKFLNSTINVYIMYIFQDVKKKIHLILYDILLYFILFYFILLFFIIFIFYILYALFIFYKHLYIH